MSPVRVDVQTSMNAKNPLGLVGIDFVEFAGPDPEALRRLFYGFGFSARMRHAAAPVEYFQQHDIHFLLNGDPKSMAAEFQKLHGPCISSMGWRVNDPAAALKAAVARGARPADGDYREGGKPVPAIRGIGDSLIYLVDATVPTRSRLAGFGFTPWAGGKTVADKGFLTIDHLTNNVEKGRMAEWAAFYKDVFGFTEVRYFDIRGAKTGLTSYALRSPDGSFCIPINEGTEDRSQINEYLREYRGPGIQHLAFTTDDIVASLDAMQGSGIETLDIDDEYYATVFDRVPNVSEDHATLKQHKILVDGDDEGYLLQIFTRNVVGPIFIEIIQRKNHASFGEGNFGALFRSIERDQERRGVL